MHGWRTATCPFQVPPPSLKELKVIEERGLKIIEYERKVQYWQAQLDELLEEQDRCCRLMRLRINARSYWDCIYPKEQLEKEFLLAALQSEQLPVELERFSEDDFPSSIRSDREIFLARVCRGDRIELQIPVSLSGDKEVMLECIKRQVQAIKYLSLSLRGDKDILRALLDHHHTLPPNFLLQFSEELRSDPSLMLDTFRHPSKDMSFLQHCSLTLRSDKQFLLKVLECFQFKDSIDQCRYNIKPENQILLYTSQQLRNDFGFVMRCVQQSGLNLQYASADLKGDPRILAAACAECREAITFSTQEAVDKGLWRHKTIAQSVISHTDDLALVSTIFERYKGDHEVTSMSILNPLTQWPMIPDDIRSNTDFVIKALQVEPEKVWRFLSWEMKSVFQVAVQVLKNPKSTEEIIVDAIETCSDLLSDRKVLKQIILNHYDVGRGTVYRAVFSSGRIDIGNDKELLLAALSQADVWMYVSEELKGDRDFLLQVAEELPFLFLTIEGNHVRENLDILIRAMKKHPEYMRQHGEDIWSDNWEHRPLCMSWLEIGGGWLWDYFERFEDDAEMILVATRHRWQDFEYASHELRQDKAFVLQALAIDTRILKFLNAVVRDEEIVMIAMSKDIRCIDSFIDGRFADHGSRISFTRKIRTRLKEYWAIQEVVLESMKPSVQDREASNLTKLNQGSATFATYIDKIASYVGVMREKREIALYTAVSNNLAAWGL